jgi:hypothetical protein
VVPTTSQRRFTPTFPNGSTLGSLTVLPDGGSISGTLGQNLIDGGARNLTADAVDNRVVTFNYVNGTFFNSFRFKLPVTIKNKFSTRGAVFYITAAAEAVDNNLFKVGLLDLSNDLTPVISYSIAGTGIRNFLTYQINIDTSAFTSYLGPGGLFVNVQGSGLTGKGLYVDQFFMAYYVSNAYANNVLKAIIYKKSSAK